MDKASALRDLSYGCLLFAFACFLIWTPPLTAQTVAPPKSVFKAGPVYGLASGNANIGTGNAAGGYFGNGSGSVFDVAITNSTGSGGQLFVLQGNGDGSFSVQPSTGFNFGTAVTDGLNLILAGPVVSPTSTDLVVTDDSGHLYLLRSNGDGTFQIPASLGQTTNTLTSYLNSSGTLNTVLSTFSSVTVLVNGGSGNFTPTVVPVPARSSPYVTAAFALNAGGGTAVLQRYSDGTAGLSQQVSGVFQPPVLLGALGIPAGSAVASQSLSEFTFNGQPYLAGIVITPTGPLTSVASAYLWPISALTTGIEISATPSVYSIPTSDAVYVTAADLDGDGIPDLIVLGGGQFSTQQTINLFLSRSPNGFAPPEIGTVGTPNEILGPGEYGTEVIVADANGDGKNDLLLYEPSQGLTVLLNQGNGVFLTPTTYAAGNTPRSIAKADFNGDGIDDLVVANGLNSATNTSDNNITVFVSDVPGHYAFDLNYVTGGNDPIAVTTGKVNGNQSIFVLNSADTTGNFSNPLVGFLQGNGDGIFVAPVSFSTGTSSSAQPTAIAAGVFDVSGNSTVVVGNSDGTINLFTYQAGAFVKGSTLNATIAAPAYGLTISSLAAADMNGDGNLDLVATLRAQCGYNFNTGQMVLTGGAVLIFAGNGAGGFQPPVSVTSSEANYDPASVSLGSLVNSTRTDMLVMDAHGYAGGCGGVTPPNPIVFTNGGNLTFAETDLAPQFGGATAIADVNGDGANDLIFSQNGLVSVLLNSGTGTFVSSPTIYVGSSSSVGLVTGSFFGAGGHDAALASTSGVAILQAVLTPPRLITPTAMALVSSSPTSIFGQPVTFTATLTPSQGALPDGEVVSFYDNGSLIGTGTTSGGVASVMTATLALGPQAITASYGGDANFQGTSGQLMQLVQAMVIPPSPTITSVTPSSGFQGQQSLSVMIAGNNFVAGSTSVTVGGGSAGVSVQSFTVNSASSATAVLNIAPATALGNYDVVVTVVGAPMSATLTSGFTVTSGTVPISVTENIKVTDIPLVAAPYAVTGIVAPVVNYSAGSIGFVGLTAGQTATQTLTVSNVGLQPLTISGATITQDATNSFSISQVQCSDGTSLIAETIQSGGECTLTISYTQPASGTPSGLIIFADTAALSNLTTTGSSPNFMQAVGLSSTVATTTPPAEPPTTIIIPTINEPITATDTPSGSAPYMVTGIVAPVVNYSAGSIGFVGLTAGQTATQTLTVSNVGLQPLTISGATITQDATNSFSISQVQCSDGTSLIAETIQSGGECTLTISYTQPASGTPSGLIIFADTAALSNLTTTGSSPNFMQAVGLSSTVATTTPPAEPPTTIIIPTINEPITVLDTPLIVAPYTVTGIEAAVVYYSAGTIGFVGVPAGQTMSHTLTVSNVGLQPLTISGATITQDGTNSFSIKQVQCSDGTSLVAETIQSGGECTLTISYTQPANGTPSGLIAFTDTAALSNLTTTGSSPNFIQSVGLSSTVTTTAPPAEPTTTITVPINETITLSEAPFVPPPYAVTGIEAAVVNYSAGSIGFVGVPAGQTMSQILTVSNIGLQPLTIFGAVIAQDASNSFSISQVLCSDGTSSIAKTIQSGAECTLTISYTQPASGSPGGSVTFTDNAGLSNLASTAAGSNFTQTLTLSSTMATTAAPTDPPTTLNLSIAETITLQDQPAATVTSRSTSTSLTSSANPSVFYQPFQLTASVNPGFGTATGTVAFYAAGNPSPIGTVTLVNGTAVLGYSYSTLGSYSISATYNGDAANLASISSTLIQVVNQAPTVTELFSSQNPQQVGQPITYTAGVSSRFGGPAAGTIVFRSGTHVLGTTVLTSNMAMLTTSFGTAGTRSITAQYVPDAYHTGSTSAALSQSVVVKFATTTALTSSPNPSTFGQPVTLDATVVSVGPILPTGMVTFKNGGTVLGRSALNNGLATLSVSTFPGGTLSLSATYNGDTNSTVSTSASLSQIVGKSATATTVMASRNPSTLGQPVTFTATVASGTTTNPTGTVTFTYGTTTLGVANLAGGKASLRISTLPHGVDTVIATYSGNGDFSASFGTLVHTVN